MTQTKTYCGFIGLIGKPNVGKSTLINALTGEKISIVSRKQQTTRHTLQGIKTTEDTQMIFVDTPGIHDGKSRFLNQRFNRNAIAALEDVDVVLWVIDLHHWSDEDAHILNLLQSYKKPIIAVANKVDMLSKNDALTRFSTLSERISYQDIIPISAAKKENIDTLIILIKKYLPEQPFMFPEEQKTDITQQFWASEIIREKLFNRVHDEVPYDTHIVIEKMECDAKNIQHVYAVIYVKRDSQKGIIIGKQGATLKMIGQQARVDMEKAWSKKVFLKLWVRTGLQLVFRNEHLENQGKNEKN